MHRFLAGLGGRLAVSCALIAVMCVVLTGAVMYTSARNNILQAEQDRLFGEFTRMQKSVVDPLECTPAECGTVSDDDLLSWGRRDMHGSSILEPASNSGSDYVSHMIPASLQRQVDRSGRISWLRERYGLSYSFLIGTPVTLSTAPTGPVPLEPAAAGNGATGPSDIGPATGATVDGSAATGRAMEAVLYGIYSLDKQEKQINALAASTVWLVAVMAAVAALFGVLLARWIGRPVRRLRLAVDRLDAGVGTLDVDVKGVQELTGLVEAFNAAGSRLSAAMGELRAKEAQSRRFVADVSHELRTPVTAMVAMADVMENSPDAPDDVQEAAAVTARSARRLHAMTEGLLEISRFDAARNTVQAECFNVRSQVLVLLESRGMVSDVEVSIGAGLRFTTDPRRFDVVVGNLLENAANHGGAPVKVHAFMDGSILVVEVSDHGRGVPAESKARLFDRFYKTDSSRSRGGSGLGLSLVQENCRLLGGTVELSISGHPTVFTVRLPPQGPDD